MIHDTSKTFHCPKGHLLSTDIVGIEGNYQCPKCNDTIHTTAPVTNELNHPTKPVYPVGVSVLLVRQGQVLLGKRLNNSAAGYYSTPGGRVEFEETLIGCAIRETREETGIQLTTDNVRIFGFRKHERYGQHYIMFYALSTEFTGEPKNIEATKCEGWNWYKREDIPSPCTEPPDILGLAFAYISVSSTIPEPKSERTSRQQLEKDLQDIEAFAGYAKKLLADGVGINWILGAININLESAKEMLARSSVL